MMDVRANWIIFAVAMASGCGSTQATVASPSAGGIRVILKGPADVTWSDSACATAADAQRDAALKGAKAALEKGGFAVVEDGADHEAEAKVALKLTRCTAEMSLGEASIALDPGGKASK